MQSILETQRRAHEEVERLSDLVAERERNDDFSEFYDRLKSIKDHFRRNPDEKVEVLELGLAKVDEDQEIEELVRFTDIENMFSGEEMRGRFLDLNACFSQYINLKNVKRINYLAYISEFDKLDIDNDSGIPSDTRKGGEYKKYLIALSTYLKEFCFKTLPLYDLEEFVKAKVDEWAEILDQGMADPELYCAPCAKQFTKKAVFDGHVPGKKHKKAGLL
ncbi:hypothetical protein HDU78_002523 [Chytriomyces hyalinus]|nr:hypothetical protein HDU78_002523 [Chytriomyces hyalinus]